MGTVVGSLAQAAVLRCTRHGNPVIPIRPGVTMQMTYISKNVLSPLLDCKLVFNMGHAIRSQYTEVGRQNVVTCSLTLGARGSYLTRKQ
jgi:hypothetical protein